MKVVAINGSARKDGNTFLLMNAALQELRLQGIDTEIIQLAGKPISGCIGCYQCFHNKDRKCVIQQDMVNECVAKMVESDGILLGSPTYFSDITAGMKAFIERAGMISRVNGNLFQRKVGAGVVTVRRAGAIHALNSLNLFFLIGGMILVGSTYWNVGVGRNIGEVQNDSEGMETMSYLGKNMAWLLGKIKQG